MSKKKQIIKSDYDTLNLWKVNIAPDDIVRDKLEYVIEEEIKNDFKGKMMISSFNLEKYFPVTDKKDEDDDNNNNIHIIVQFSATTGKCHPIFYLSNKNHLLKPTQKTHPRYSRQPVSII
uniref:Uncharacterized protein n=1 Tax=Rhizophagus irregularis (strain DAOM 181602 / DAOM 197198 / MUCL 43194) TaxID=747089 RepID=U9TGJ5_RHIID